MKEYLTFASNTLTFRAEQALLASGYAVKVIPKPPGMVGRCTLALALPADTRERALALLAQRRIPVYKVHVLP